MLTAEAYQAIPGHQAHECRVCGAVPNGQGSSSEQYVTFYRDPAPDEPGWIPPALVEMVRDEPGQVLVQHRLFDGRTVTVRVKEAWCQGCVSAAARQLGWADRGELRAELEGKDSKIADLTATVAEKDERISDLEDAVRSLREQVTIQSVPDPDPDAPAAKRKPKSPTSRKGQPITPRPARAAA